MTAGELDRLADILNAVIREFAVAAEDDAASIGPLSGPVISEQREASAVIDALVAAEDLYHVELAEDRARARVAERRQKTWNLEEEGRQAAERIWSRSVPIEGTPASTYLESRGLCVPSPSPYLRYCSRLWNRELAQWCHGLVAAVTKWPGSEVWAVHRIFLSDDGRAKAAVTKPKMTLGPFGTGAVRLGEASRTIAVGEGLETCLAVQQSTGIRTWAAIGTSNMKTLILPPVAQHVVVLADHDEAGKKAARIAAERWVLEGRRVEIALPPTEGSDFADLLVERTA